RTRSPAECSPSSWLLRASYTRSEKLSEVVGPASRRSLADRRDAGPTGQPQRACVSVGQPLHPLPCLTADPVLVSLLHGWATEHSPVRHFPPALDDAVLVALLVGQGLPLLEDLAGTLEHTGVLLVPQLDHALAVRQQPLIASLDSFHLRVESIDLL